MADNPVHVFDRENEDRPFAVGGPIASSRLAFTNLFDGCSEMLLDDARKSSGNRIVSELPKNNRPIGLNQNLQRKRLIIKKIGR
jgi:hypothetical protein